MSASVPVSRPMRRFARAALPAILLAAVAVTCDSPTAVRRPVSIAMAPSFSAAGISAFAGLAVDSVRAIVSRHGGEVLASQTLPFSADSTQLSTTLTVTINGAQEQVELELDLLAGGVTMFTGQDTVTIVGGLGTQTAPIPMRFVGPGMNVASLHVTPRDSGAVFGSQAQIGVTALDSSNNPVSQFYVTWSTSSTTDAVNAAGTFRAGSTRNVAWVRAVTPSGIRDSARIFVSPAPASVLADSGNNQSAIAHTTLPRKLVAKVVASDNQPVVGAVVTFTPPSGGSVSPASGVTDTAGLVWTTATLGTTIGSQTFTASTPGATSANFSATGTAGVATHFAFTTQPATVAAGASISPAVRLVAEDSAGNAATGFAGNVTIALGANPGGAVLSGTLTASTVAGAVTFSNLSLDKAASGYTLVATSGLLPPDTSAPFTVTAGPAATLALVSGNNQNGAPSTALAAPIVVKVTDQYGNPVQGTAVTFAVTAGGGSAGTPNATTNASGQASTSWTLGTSGTQTMTATSAGLTGSPVTVNATVTGVASTTVTPHLDTLISLGDTITLKAQAKDFTGANVSGSFTWSSADTSLATVSAAGLVTAVKNGSVLITAHEAGGSQDTARIVVQQKVATVNVTPANRSIYLTRTFQFSASAVDGRGHPIAGYGPYVWSSTAPAVASVDSTGLVTGTGLGNAQIKATAGTIVGVSNVAILTPITRIVVAVDTAGAAKPDTFSMASLGLHRTYVAIAHDTLDNVMTGVSFTWASTNPSVASLDSLTTTTARATAQANGITSIQASAQGVTSNPGASLTVSQVLASIVLSLPASGDTVGVGGNISLTARGKDANGFFIPGLAFHFVSSDTTVAKVDSLTGTVSGIAVGNATITASNGAINASVGVVVSTGGPAIISFGRDTLSVGRGSSGSIPVLLSKPYASPLIVKLANPAAFAHWQGAANGFATVTIPAGQTAANATIVGDSAGTTSVTATDSTGAGYSAASATLKVTANMRLTSGGYAINTNDVVATQVLLSDPSPAGGTYVTFSYGTAGVASVSPSPAYIPAGQLAADIQITGVDSGSTTITPVATGVNGQASNFTAYPAYLRLSTTLIRLGLGQYEPNVYVYVPTSDNLAIPVTLANSDTTVAVTPPSVTIPSGTNYAYFTTQAVGLGSATIAPSSPKWIALNSMTVQSTTPHLGISGGGTLNTTNPAVGLTVYTEDSAYSAHYRINSLVVHLSSSNDSIMHVIDTVITVQPGYYYTSGRVIPGGTATGSAYIIATAPGHTPDSTLYTTIGPKLNFSFGTIYLGAGQYEPNAYVYTPNNVNSALIVSVVSSDTTIATAPTADTIPTGTNYKYFTTFAKAPGTVTFTGTAPGYQPDTDYVVVTRPRITTSGNPTLNNFGPGTNFTIYATDSMGTAHYQAAPVAVSVHVIDSGIVAVDSSSLTIPAGSYYNGQAHITPLAVGTARIAFSVAAGSYITIDTIRVTVVTPKVNLSFYTSQLGRRQHFDASNNGFYVYTPDNRRTPLAVTITHNAAIDSLTVTSIVIDSGTNYKYLDAYGLANGLDTIVISAPGYYPDTAYLTVSSPRLTNCCMPGNLTTTNPPFGMTVYTTDSVGNAHWAMDSLTIYAVSSDTTVIKPSHARFRFPAGRYYLNDTNLTVNVMGPGTASITYTDSSGVYAPTTTSTITVTGPSLSLANNATMLGMRQTDGGGSYVYIPNSTANPLVVHLLSTATTVVTVPDSVIIPAGSNYAYFTVTAGDTIGTIQVQATAIGYSSASMNVQVTLPRFVFSTGTSVYTTSGRQGVTVYATDQNGNSHYVRDTVYAHLASSNTNVAWFDSSVVAILPGHYYNNAAAWYPNTNQATPGTAQLSASDTVPFFYHYNTGTVNVAVNTPSLNLTWSNSALGIGQYFEPYAYTPNNQLQNDSVPLQHTGTARVTTAQYQTNTPISYVTIPAGTNYAYFRVIGASKGTDTLTASLASPPHNPYTAYTQVDTGRISVSSWPTSLAVGDSVLLTLYPADQNSSGHNVADSTTFTLTPNGNLVFVPYQGSGSTSSATVAPGGYYVYVWVKAVASGTGSVQISNANYLTYSNTVTVP